MNEKLDKRRRRVDVEDILLLAVQLGPEGAKEKINEMYTRIQTIVDSLDTIFSTPNVSGLQGFLGKLDGIISLISSITGQNLGAFAVFRNLLTILSSGRQSFQSIFSIVSSFLPSEARTFLGEAGRLFNMVMGIVHFLRTVDPRTIVQRLIGGFLASLLGRLPGPMQTIFSLVLGGTPLGSLLGGLFSSGGTVGTIVGRIFGTPPTTLSVKVMDSLSGGFEAPDGILLSEKHIRRSSGGKSNE